MSALIYHKEVILLNALKHHAGSIRSFAAQAFIDIESLPQLCKVVGTSQMDLYYGRLSIDAIRDEVMVQAEHIGVLDPEKYESWLKNGNGYKKLILSDSSVWILRWGEEKTKFIHIHPGRYSPHTIRVTANTLKTAIAVCACLKRGVIADTNLQNINVVRRTVLGLSPIRQMKKTDPIVKTLGLLLDVEDEIGS